MPLIEYVARNFAPDSQTEIDRANVIVAEYLQQGFKLTLRQLYYQFVARAFIPNTMKSYKRLGSIVNDARLAGLIDWDVIEDRTREVQTKAHWTSPRDIVRACADQFRVDKWADQPYRPEVWIEKEALAGVVEGVCTELDISYLACRGYTSQSEMWQSAMRLKEMIDEGQTPVILHFGDHDPSGIDMSRDIEDRLEIFGVRQDMEFRRLALNMAQVRQYSPPPNPAKTTDSRFTGYMNKYGHESWELDALEPRVIADLIRREVRRLRDKDKWTDAVAREDEHKERLAYVAKNWDTVSRNGKGS